MKKVLFFATALAALVSCTSNDFVGNEDVGKANEIAPISFGFKVPTPTRGDLTGSDAAEKLSNTFYVYGIKNESTDGAGNVGTGNLVYNNYKVTWTDNTAWTTTSNTENWEYVGNALTAKEQANVTANSGAAVQTIKYWDYGASDYTFYAVSALSSDIEGDLISIVKNQTVTSSVYDNGYTVTLDANASLDNLYFAERVPITKSSGTDRTADNAYGGNVTFRFHNMTTKVRVAMYETIQGYSVKINSFKTENSATPTFAGMTTEETTNFKANFVNNAAGTAGSMTVKYVSSGDRINQPTVAFTPTGNAANVLELGGNIISVDAIGETATTATFDKTIVAPATDNYTSVFPKEDNTQNLKLKVCYTLTAPVTGETITVTDATAEIPAIYLTWKPGYAYTYIFKISDNTNGTTGGSDDPAGLYPITFDAVVVSYEDGMQETITTVSEPSITTFGYDTTNSKYITENNEYPAGSDVYATIMDGSSVKDFTLYTDVNVYAVTSSDATHFPVTEASLAEALAETSTGTDKITATPITASAYDTYLSAAPSEETSVPGVDGLDITDTHALKLKGVKYVANYVYAVEYITGKWNTTGSKYDSAPAGVQLYSDADGTTEATWADANTTYYTRTVPKNVYKIIKVPAPAGGGGGGK